MDPDGRWQSPLISTASDDACRRRVPSLNPPQPPRLGIIHLLGWTLCVAAYLGFLRLFVIATWGSPEEAVLIWWGYTGLGGGTALGGLVLFVVWRCRGVQFPTRPGEYLLVTVGLHLVALWTFEWIHVLAGPYASSLGQSMAGMSDPWWHVRILGPSAVVGLAYLWAAWQVKTPRWRILFLMMLAGEVLLFLGLDYFGLVRNALHFVSGAILVVIALWDHFQGKRYPWTHWLGIAVGLWYAALWVGWYLWWVR